jgi:MtrB/PioB family decaheme-associated outer membrane protein
MQMKTTRDLLTLKTSVLMVHGALAMMALTTVANAADAPAKPAASAEDEAAVNALVRPTSQVGLGIGYVGKGSYKYGEYNGLERKDPYFIGNFDLEKRSPYDSSGVEHFRFRGDNLGLETRDATLDYGWQGRFKLHLGYDELRRNSSDSYQTPFLGGGTNKLTLPSNWLRPVVPQVNAVNHNFRGLSAETGEAPSLVGGVSTAPTAAQLATGRAIRAADVPAFRNFNLYTKRTNYDAGFNYEFNHHWQLTSSFKREYYKGTKPLDALNAFAAGGGDSAATLPELLNSTTDQFNLALNHSGDKLFAQVAYYGSLYRNFVKSMTWEDPKQATLSPSISTPPSNQFHEINLTGGYSFTPTTKLVLNGSYGRNTQNDAFLTPPSFNPTSFIVPGPSADGVVITKSLGLKLSVKPTKLWNITTGLKYNDRDNRTPVRRYIFQDADVATNAVTNPSPFIAYLGNTGIGQNTNIFNNRPLSKETIRYNFDNSYRVTSGHTLAGGYDFERIKRNCTGTWISCTDADTTKEHTLKAEWRAVFTEDLSTRIAYAHARRKVNYNENAWLAEVPLANVVGGPVGATPAPTISAYDFMLQNGLTGFGPVAGFPTVPLTGNAAILIPGNNIVLQRYYGGRNNVSEIPGMRRFNLADRNRDKIRTSADWQATERLSFQAGLDFNRDNFANSVYGLKEAKDYALNLDSTYVIGENLSANVFYSFENMQSKLASTPANISNVDPAAAIVNNNNVIAGSPCFTSLRAQNGVKKIDPCNQWSAEQRDGANTIGFALNKKNMLGNRLDLTGKILFTRARTDINVRGGTYVTNPLSATAGEPGVFYIPGENYPGVTTDILELRLNGEYRFDKSSAIRMGYSFRRLKSSGDYAYEGLQFGGATAELPTNERVARYSVHAVGVYYVYRFQ